LPLFQNASVWKGRVRQRTSAMTLSLPAAEAAAALYPSMSSAANGRWHRRRCFGLITSSVNFLPLVSVSQGKSSTARSGLLPASQVFQLRRGHGAVPGVQHGKAAALHKVAVMRAYRRIPRPRGAAALSPPVFRPRKRNSVRPGSRCVRRPPETQRRPPASAPGPAPRVRRRNGPGGRGWQGRAPAPPARRPSKSPAAYPASPCSSSAAFRRAGRLWRSPRL
jgi:hypothetical protein